MRHDNKTDQASPSAERQFAGLIAKFEPKNQKLIKSVRRALRKRFPAVNELVYDYTRSLVIGYSPNERGSDGIVAISADANGVRLFFNQGVSRGNETLTGSLLTRMRTDAHGLGDPRTTGTQNGI